jgi:hypothetical protein
MPGTQIGTAGTRTWVALGDGTVVAEVWGAGGAGGGARSGSYTAGGGGGGAYSRATLIVTSGSTYNYYIGTGGACTTGSYGTKGGNTWFKASSLLFAEGGYAGGRGWTPGGTSGAGGASASGVGDVKYSGGAGKSGSAAAGYGGGGGASGYNAGNGGSATAFTGATGQGNGTGGQGGNGGTAHAAGVTPATYPGGGGGGAGDYNASNLLGGVGGAGQITLWWNALEYSVTFVADPNITVVYPQARGVVSWMMLQIPSISGPTVYNDSVGFSVAPRLSVDLSGNLVSSITFSGHPSFVVSSIQTILDSVSLASVARLFADGAIATAPQVYNEVISIGARLGMGVVETVKWLSSLNISVTSSYTASSLQTFISNLSMSVASKLSDASNQTLDTSVNLNSSSKISALTILGAVNNLSFNTLSKTDMSSTQLMLAAIGVPISALLSVNWSASAGIYNESLSLAVSPSLSVLKDLTINQLLSFSASPKISVSASMVVGEIFKISSTSAVSFNTKFVIDEKLINNVTTVFSLNSKGVIQDNIVIHTQSGITLNGVINKIYSDSISIGAKLSATFETMRPYFGFEELCYGSMMDMLTNNKYINWQTLSAYAMYPSRVNIFNDWMTLSEYRDEVISG